MAQIIFADGKTFAVEVNGDCYIMDDKPEFPADLSIVTIEDGEQTIVIHDAILIECASVDGRYWFAFIKESPEEKTIRELQESNQMLIDCILEMSEIIYGG